jgi:hypothetical protein
MLVVVAVLLSGCGGKNDDSPDLRGVRPRATDITAPGTNEPTNDELFGDVPTPLRNQLVLPAVEGAPGALIFVINGELYLARFDGQEATHLSSIYYPVSVEPALDGTGVVYVGADVRDPGSWRERRMAMLTYTDFTTLENRVLNEPDTSQNLVVLLDWQPGGDVIAFWGPTVGISLVRVDGSSEVVPISGAPFMAWLDDGSILGLMGGGQDAFGQQEIFVAHMDRTTGEQTPVDITIRDVMSADFVNLEPDAAALGYTYADTYRDFYRAARLPDGSRAYIQWPEWVKAPQDLVMCSHWEIRQQPTTGEMQPIYTSDDTTALSDLTVMPDGSLLFLRWALDGCNFTGNLVISLMRMVPGEEPTVITDQIDGGINGTPNELRTLSFVHGRKYSVTEDGRYVFWIGGGLLTGQSAIHVTNLETGESTMLMQVDRTSLGDGFEDVHWVSLGK